MTLHKLSGERDGREGGVPRVTVAMNQELYDLAGAMIRARAVQDCDIALQTLPVHRVLRWSVRRKVADFFDDLALDIAFTAQRIHAGSVLLTAPGLFIHAVGASKGSYCSCWFTLWAESRARADEAAARLERISGEQRLRDETFTLDWQFTTSRGELRSSSFEELADPCLFDEAYPSLCESVAQFVNGFLSASDAVLILLGPPGTGKTRLVRAILSEMSRRKGENAEVMYTADKRALTNDEIFVDFITGSHDAFVIEDTDHLLKARTSGNEEMHRFLTIADGIARAQGRKIIFTTNLPNVTDIDDALVRPGRCYAVKNLRSLMPDEALRLAGRICGDDAGRARRATDGLIAMNARSYSVAQVYRACA
jgi:ATPase family associated with various cellular activities (AAA)